MAQIKKRRDDLEETTNEKPAYIDWQEFNRLQKAKGNPRPEQDMPDDEASDELDEVVTGKDYPEEPEDNDVVLADIPHAARDEDNLLEDRTTEDTAEASPRPDPKEDRFSDTNTH